MEATQKRMPLTGKMLQTRGGTLLLAGGIALLAAIVLVAFLQNYKDDVTGGTVSAPTLVASALIPKGTSGDVVIGETLFKPADIAESKLKEGALPDASGMAGKVATRDIYPGQQITAADFSGKADPLRGKLTGNQRATTIPISVANGLIGTVRTGDRVDVYAGFSETNSARGASEPVVRTLLQNALVLKAPTGGASEFEQPDQTSALTLRVTEKEAAALAYSVDNGRIWVALRPPAGASQGNPVNLDLDQLLAETAPAPTQGSK
jgi:Flp pilus assembly protein CpaB